MSSTKHTQELTFDICRAHNNMQNKQVNDGAKKQAVSFLKRQRNPFDFDVRSSYWDGENLETSGHVTGDEFLKNPDQLDFVAKAAIKKATS